MSELPPEQPTEKPDEEAQGGHIERIEELGKVLMSHRARPTETPPGAPIPPRNPQS